MIICVNAQKMQLYNKLTFCCHPSITLNLDKEEMIN